MFEVVVVVVAIVVVVVVVVVVVAAVVAVLFAEPFSRQMSTSFAQEVPGASWRMKAPCNAWLHKSQQQTHSSSLGCL